jgi:HEAT repeat protein
MMLIFLVLLQWTHAAPHKAFPAKVPASSVKELLKSSDQVAKIKDLGPEGYKHLREIMLSSKEPMNARWQATLALARIGGKESQPDIKLALENPTWYMRSAGLLATSIISKDHGVDQAKKSLRKDPALLVRATALQIIAQEKVIDRDYLWKELYNPLNFHKGESLSLRLSLLQVLAKQTKKTESAKFVALTRDKQPEIKRLAKNVIEKEFFPSKSPSVKD